MAPAKKKATKPNNATTPKAKPALLQWAKAYFEDRGVDYDFAVANGVKVAPPSESRIRGYEPPLAGIVFENIDPITGNVSLSSRIRYQDPPLGAKGKPNKFKMRKGCGNDPYFAPAHPWKKAFTDPKIPIVVSEGECRSLAAAKHGIACIGCGGVDGVSETGSNRSRLHPSLRRIKWRGRKVYLAFDADVSTNQRVNDAQSAAARLLTDAGAKVHVLTIPRITVDGAAGLDDLLAGDGGLATFKRLCDAAPLISVDLDKGGQPNIECLADIEQRQVDWLSKPRLPKGMLAGIEGNPGDGKTFVVMKIAAEGSRGRDPFNGTNCKPFTTVYMSRENITSITTKARILAMGGDQKKFFTLDDVRNADGTTRPVTLSDVPVIERAVIETGASLVAIDPLQSYMGADVDSHKANETRPLLDALAQMAERQNVCVLIVRHLAKGSGNRAVHRGLGSIDITGAMRSVLMVGTAPDDPQNRALVHVKSNVGEIADSLAFGIEGKDSATKLIWKGKSQLTAGDLAAPEGERRKSKVDMAGDYLFEQLEDGPKPAKELEGLYDARTLQRAATKIGIVRSGHGGKGGAWVWGLPKFGTKKGAESNTTS